MPENLAEAPNEWMNWETVNPQWWVPRGYAAVRVDGRGTGTSPGQYDPWSLAEAVDLYDAIEWAAAQPWCNGKVGLLGSSYFAINQWFAADLQPPSLKAIIPWEGFADIYRDALYHGGLLSLFMTNWYTAHLLHHTLGRASQHPSRCLADQHASLSGCAIISTAAHFAARRRNGTRSMYRCFASAIGRVWGCVARQHRAFMRAETPHKKLRIHLGSHVHPFYTEDGSAIRSASSIIGSRASTTA